MNYYNDNDAYAAQWLSNLVAADALPAGTVDSRSIADISPGNLAGYDSCHFFAGIGGWPYALQLAGWPVDRPVWTGSCPCQPFSAAGKQGGSADERHLWPQWFRLIRECRPDTIFGEQVAGAVGFGWLDRVCADLEALGYACGAAVLGAHSVGAPHIRQRLFWVAVASEQGIQSDTGTVPRGVRLRCQPLANRATGRMADAQHPFGGPLGLDRPDGRDGADAGRQETHGEPGARSEVRGLGVSEGEGRETLNGFPGAANARPEQPADTGFWDNAIWLPCLDGKARRTQPGIFPLAARLPAAMDGTGPISRVGVLKGAGNSIVPQVAAEFIRIVMDAC